MSPVVAEPVHSVNERPPAVATSSIAAPPGNDAAPLSSVVTAASEALDTNIPVKDETSTTVSELHCSSDEGPQLHTNATPIVASHFQSASPVNAEAPVSTTGITTGTTAPIAVQGQKKKGHRRSDTAADTSDQGARVKKRKAASKRKELVQESSPKKRKIDDIPTVRASAR